MTTPQRPSRFDSRRPDWRNGRVDMSHGAGGRAGADLIDHLFIQAFDNPWLRRADDGACLPFPQAGERLVVTTDGHVVTPLFFPGGDIGKLSVNGTINDLAVMGARPLYLSAGFIIEEGFALGELRRIVESMAQAAQQAEVPIVAGDTKVVERGKGDGVFITTTGIGAVMTGRDPSGSGARVGDAVLLSGPPGEHGAAILCVREALAFETEIRSDCAPLHSLCGALFDAMPAPAIRCLRDPTRGGVATALNEIAAQSAVGLLIDEMALPSNSQVEAACELLGLDPLYMACEGRLLAVVDADYADIALATMRAHPLGEAAMRIGTVINDEQHFVQLATRLGGRRIIDWLAGEPLPRIC